MARGILGSGVSGLGYSLAGPKAMPEPSTEPRPLPQDLQEAQGRENPFAAIIDPPSNRGKPTNLHARVVAIAKPSSM